MLLLVGQLPRCRAPRGLSGREMGQGCESLPPWLLQEASAALSRATPGVTWELLAIWKRRSKAPLMIEQRRPERLVAVALDDTKSVPLFPSMSQTWRTLSLGVAAWWLPCQQLYPGFVPC